MKCLMFINPLLFIIAINIIVVQGVFSVKKLKVRGKEMVKLESVFDPSCKNERQQNIFEFGYEFDKLSETSLFRKEGRLESYVGYPCNTRLFYQYQRRFLLQALECPFEGNRDLEFQKFIWEELWNFNQTAPENVTVTYPNTLLFQYICFSNQFEECVASPEKKALNGSCDGVCQCMESVPINKKTGYPHKQGLNEENSKPVIILENEIRCGVKAGGLCIPTWNPTCQADGNLNYNVTLEHAYNVEDFKFKCESSAGCHTTKRICECAQGHSCSDHVSAANSNVHANVKLRKSVIMAWTLVAYFTFKTFYT